MVDPGASLKGMPINDDAAGRIPPKETDDFENYRLNATTRRGKTIQFVFDAVTGHQVQQTWNRRRHLGAGAFGEVWQEGREDEYSDWHYRAVKSCSARHLETTQVDYRRELAALALFSRSEVSSTISRQLSF